MSASGLTPDLDAIAKSVDIGALYEAKNDHTVLGQQRLQCSYMNMIEVSLDLIGIDGA